MLNPIFSSRYKVLCCTIFTLLVVFSLPGNLFAGEKRIAVLPFSVYGSETHQHMEKALPDMFSSRLARTRGYSMVSASAVKALEIDPADLGEDRALAIGKQSGADFVLYGTLTVLQETWSMDALMLDVSGENVFGTFSRSGADTRELIPGLESMAAEMREALEEGGRKTDTYAARPAPKGKPATPHAGFDVAEPARRELSGAWAGPEMNFNFTGIAAGDLTGDGKTETVLVDAGAVYIYSLTGNRFNLLEKIDAPANTTCIALDVGDINRDGKAEIFVTARNNRSDMLRSFILENRDGRYRRIVEQSPWFYRVMHDPDNGPVLLGQHHIQTADPFKTEVVHLKFENGNYVPGESFVEGEGRGSGGRDLNLLGMARGRILGQDADAAIVSLDNRDKLHVLLPNGDGKWKSNRNYGGSTLFMEGPRKGKGQDPERYFLSGRVLVHNPSDAPSQVFTFRNKGLSPINLKRMRVYTEGEVLSLAWDGHGLQEEWKTRGYDGHFRDLCLADLNNDGNLELAALLIRSEGATFFSNPLSQVLVFPIQDVAGKN